MKRVPRRIVITGGEGGLGQALAGEFRQAGWTVEAPGRASLDVRDAAAVHDFFEAGEVDLLVCNAGLVRDEPLLKLSEADWDEVLTVNLEGAAHCARAASRSMLRRGAGHIVFVSSFSALHPPPGQAAYAAAKAGLIGFAKSLARELGSRGVRTNVLLPGFLNTSMTAKVTESRREEIRAAHVLGRYNSVEAVARFVRCLEEDLLHTSGQVFQLDSRVAGVDFNFGI